MSTILEVKIYVKLRNIKMRPHQRSRLFFWFMPQSKISLHGNTLLTMAYRLQAETASAVFFRLISRYGLKIVYRKHKPLHNVAPFRCFFCKSRCCNIFGKSKMGSCAFLHRSARLFGKLTFFFIFSGKTIIIEI